ncbi:pyocin knob domain-containing protein [Limosilactobacillus caviae]|uniref:pyocin knob domain-containing protein n=2 Tax=Limosilactobacillus caviae TaxID=1769424 RepID=UPI003D1AF757
MPSTDDVQHDLTELSGRITATSQQFSSYYTKSETDNKTNSAKNDAINTIRNDGNWQGLSNILTNSGFLQTADGFMQKVQQTTVPMFNGGGVNLLLNTQNFDHNWAWDNIDHSYAKGVLTLSDTNNGNSRMYQGLADNPAGKTFSLSFNAKISADCDSENVSIKAGPYDAPKWITVTGKNSQSYKIEGWKWTGTSINFSLYVIGGKIDISNLKLEYGSVATPYSPNPADLATQSAFSELSQSLEGLRSTVGSNYGDLQSRISQSSSTVRTDLTNKINGVQNQVTTTADGLNAKIGAIQIGGRNYLRNSDKSITGWAQDLGAIPNEVLNELAGKTITVSCDVEWSGYAHDNSKQNRLGFEASVTGSDGHSYWLGAWKNPTILSGKERISTQYTLPAGVTFTVNNNGQNGYVSINGSGKVSHAKIEIGNRMTDWSPAPEDAEQAFAEVNATINGLKSTVSGNYGTLTNQITQTTQTTRNEITNKISGLQTQLTQQANSFNVSLNSLRKETVWQKVTSAIDANNYRTTGNYWVQSTPSTNTPDSSAWAYLQVVAYPDVKRVKQTWQRDNDENQAYTRLLVGDRWTAWQRTVTGGNIMAQINMSAGTTLIQNDKIYMDASSTVFSGNAFIPSAAITSLNADKITTGTLNAANVNIINLNANNITTGTINGQNLKINLNTGEILFQHGKITSTLGTLNINVDTGIMSVTDMNGAGVYYSNGEMFLNDGPINGWFNNPAFGGIRRSPFGWKNGSTGIQMYSKNGVSLETSNYNGGFANGSIIDSTSTGAAVEVDSSGSTTINGANVTSVVGGSQFETGSMGFKNRAHIWVGSNITGESGNRIVMDGDFVHIISAYRHTTGDAPNLFVANDGALVRSTSASKYKTNIKRSHSTDYGERLLNLPVATWIDKGQKERYEAGKRHIKPNKYFGMIAEDLADAGLDLLVSRNVDGEIEGIQYERIAPALIPVIKKLKDKVEKLEEKLNEQSK